MKLINLTPHVVTIAGTSIKPEDVPARVAEEIEEVSSTIGDYDIQVKAKRLGQVVGLPDVTPNTGYIASFPVAQSAWAAGRTDVFVPGEFHRGESGSIDYSKGAGCLFGNPSLVWG